jgi:chaperonin GroEL (HSP60 family)
LQQPNLTPTDPNRPQPTHFFQDVVAGDGTTSVVVICGALLKKAQELLAKGVHPTVVSDAFNKAVTKANEVGGGVCV